jgi:hypothetical protein
MRSPGRAWLLWGALLSFAIALFHIIIAFVDIPLAPPFGSLLRRDAFISSLFGALYFLFRYLCPVGRRLGSPASSPRCGTDGHEQHLHAPWTRRVH